jgi:hypothetical protein
MLVAKAQDDFQPTQNKHSLSLVNQIQTPTEATPASVASQWPWARVGLRGLGYDMQGPGLRTRTTGYGLGCPSGGCGSCVSSAGGCSGMGGLGFDLETFAGTSTVWLVAGGGLLLYWVLMGSPARERRAALRGAKEEYRAKVRKIKGTHSRVYSSKAGTGKKWAKGAYRSEDYEE